jgi:hypothetical protein
LFLCVVLCVVCVCDVLHLKMKVKMKVRLRESRNSVFSTCNLVTETELQLLFIGMINSDRVNNVTRYYALRL